MFVADLRHFLDLDDDSPATVRRVAAHLGAIVQAATSRPAGQSWVTGIACTRRPGRRPCTGRIGLHRSEVPPSIRWECILCGDEGVIHGWEGSYADLRSSDPTRGSAPTGGSEPTRIAVSDEAAALLRTVLLVDADAERVVHGGHSTVEGVEMDGDEATFGELLDSVAAEANAEVGARRRSQLDALFVALGEALSTPQPAGDPTPPAGSVRIRPATVDDLEEVLQLWIRARVEPTRTDSLEGLLALVERDPSALLLAEDANGIAGTVIAAWDGWRGSIYRLAVVPSHRRQGLATALLETARRRLHAAGALRLQAIVDDSSPAALGFWNASGWERQTDRARFVDG